MKSIHLLTALLENEMQNDGDTAPLTVANPKPAEWSPPTAGNEPGKKATRKAQRE
jgi:hypothetical protein